MSFEGEVPTLACGQSATIKLSGKAPKATAFVVTSDDVQVSDEKASGTSWEAKVKVASTAAPGRVRVEAHAPVSDANTSQPALEIRGRYELDLKYEDGFSAHFTPETIDADTNRMQGTLAFTRGKEKKSLRAEVEPQDGRLRVALEVAEEEQKARDDEGAALQKLNAEGMMQGNAAAIQKCFELKDPARMPCVQKVQEKAQKDADAFKAKMDAVQASFAKQHPQEAWACQELELTASKGALTGTAHCSMNTRELKISSGTLKCLGPLAKAE